MVLPAERARRSFPRNAPGVLAHELRPAYSPEAFLRTEEIYT